MALGLALTAVYYDSFGWHTREEYETFVRVYGFDIMTWPGYPVMREVREFLMVSWVIQKARESERTAAEAPTQVAAWAGHSVQVLLQVYAKCIAGRDEIARRRIEDALGLTPSTQART